jgi:signal transduction histidine kinase
MTNGEVPAPTPRANTLILCALAAVMVIVAIIGEPGANSPLSVIALLVGLIPWALIAGGVRVPLPAFIAVAIAVAVVVVLVESNPGGMFPVMIALVWVALNTDDWRVLAGTFVASIAPIIIDTMTGGGVDENGTVYMVSGAGFSFVTGRLLRRQSQLTADLRAMDQLAAEHAAAAERTHIAREVHDVVAHSLTVVMLHLTGARRALATDPARAEEALARAEEVGRESLDSVRQVVGLLRDGERSTSGATDPPQPGLGDIEGLIDGYRLGGLDVVDHVELDDVELDLAIQLVVYRVVQESLSNALQHSPGASCEVRISVSADGDAGGAAGRRTLTVDVTNSAPARALLGRPDAAAERVGLGVSGMRERVRAAGGSFAAGPTSDGGWSVRAMMPLRFSTVQGVTWPAVPTTP